MEKREKTRWEKEKNNKKDIKETMKKGKLPETGGNRKKAVPIDYSVYIMSKKEKFINILMAIPVIYIIGYLFYKNHAISIVLSFGALLYPKIKTRQIIKRRKEELNIQFKDMLYSLQSSIWSGKPVELAFREIVKDLKVLYPESNTPIIEESLLLTRKIEMNETIESAVMDFGKRTGIEDIMDFAEVLQTCKRTGGNLVEVIKRTTGIINDRIEIKQEINTMLAEKRMEMKILNLMPVGLLVILSFTAGDYIAPLYNTLTGRIVMTVSALLIAAAYYISARIMDIEV